VVLALGSLVGCDTEAGSVAAAVDAAVDAAAVEPDAGPVADAGCFPSEEVCNGEDDDCDGLVDGEDDDLQAMLFSDPLNCGGCGVVCAADNAVTACRPPGECYIIACEPGFNDYNTDISDGCESDCFITAGGAEVCDTQDNDCDGLTDEGFDLQTDAEHCGVCGNACGAAANGLAVCEMGDCVLAECDAGWVDLDGDLANGCEFACTIRSTDRVREFCNGLDDDCDGAVDEAADLAPPEDDFCGLNGVCDFQCEADEDCNAADRCNDGGICVPRASDALGTACETDADCQAAHPGLACIGEITLDATGTPTTTRRCVERIHAPTCDGEAGYRCVRPPTYQDGNEIGACDGLDNDCDGEADEEFVADLFVDGAQRTQPRNCAVGEGICRREGPVRCTADGSGTECVVEPGEPASPTDTDCDGVDDNCNGQIDEDFEDEVVEIGGVRIFAYEASRPGATRMVAGLDLDPEDDVVAFIEARACSRAGVLPWANVTYEEAAAACEAAGARLCTGAEWTAVCDGGAGQAYPYGAMYSENACNGGGNDTDPDTAGVQDALLPTGSLAMCVRGGVYDLSGNLKEWTQDGDPNLRPVRGGGFETNPPAGLTCGQVGDLKPGGFRAENLGFRCCLD
jgi:hypothetical protein